MDIIPQTIVSIIFPILFPWCPIIFPHYSDILPKKRGAVRREFLTAVLGAELIHDLFGACPKILEALDRSGIYTVDARGLTPKTKDYIDKQDFTNKNWGIRGIYSWYSWFMNWEGKNDKKLLYLIDKYAHFFLDGG